MPNSQLLLDLPAIPRRPYRVRRARAIQGPPEAPLPDFPIIPDIPMRDQGDFQRVVVILFVPSGLVYLARAGGPSELTHKQQQDLLGSTGILRLGAMTRPARTPTSPPISISLPYELVFLIFELIPDMTQNFLFLAIDRHGKDGIDRCAGQRGSWIYAVNALKTSSDADAERRVRSTKKRYDEASTSIQHRDPWPRDETFAEFADPKKAIDRLRFMPDSQLLRDLPAIPHRPPGVRRARATQGPPEAPLPDFPIIPDIHMPDQGDFQRVVVDALRAILARVSCTSRRTIRAHSPEAAGPSRQHRDPSSGSDDETSEDTD
ncbi:hypothetical protein F2Q69_00021386 [Brassica cretica]|uniref:Uncharacterized protein n=1 Tax=Brassica cretica TaxID=69181 RepID=A0A8S9QD20_BRACR|nr:hypothetical protein F2Q69_00021386 [Brassica cretica]